jgi:phosphonate dehydrogenase
MIQPHMQHKPTVVLTSHVHAAVHDHLRPHANIIMPAWPHPLTGNDLHKALHEASAVMVFMHDRVDTSWLDAAPKLKLVAGALKGYDNIDVAACTDANITVSIVNDLLTEPTAELTLGLMIALGRHINAGDRLVRSGGFVGWRPRYFGKGIANTTVGLLGFGAIGKAIAQRLCGFNCRLLCWDQQQLTDEQQQQHNIRQTNFNDLLGQCDWIISCLPLNEQTQHILNRQTLKLIRSDAMLINPSRGSVVDEVAVADALEHGQLGGYAADVFEMEDWARDDRPQHIETLLLQAQDRTVLTPHLGSAVDSIRLQIEMQAAVNIVDFLQGRPPRDRINHCKQPTETLMPG